MSTVSSLTLTSLMATVVTKLAVDGFRHFPRYSWASAAKTVGWVAAGFSCFLAPHKMPDHYWFWHSAWHVCMGLAYYELYCTIEGVPRGGAANSVSKTSEGGKGSKGSKASRSRSAHTVNVTAHG